MAVKERQMIATRPKFTMCCLWAVLCYMAGIRSLPAIAGEMVFNKDGKSLAMRVAAVDANFDSGLKEEQKAAIFDQNLAALLEQANGDLANLIQQLLPGDERILTKAVIIAGLLHQNKGLSGFTEKIDSQEALPSRDAAELIVRITIQGNREQNEEKYMLIPYLLGIFLPYTSEGHLIDATVSHLKTDNVKLKKHLLQTLDYKLRGELRNGPFVPFGNMLKAQGGKIDEHLVQYMLLYDPEEGLSTLALYYLQNREERTALLLAYRILDTTIWKEKRGLERPPKIEADQLDALATLGEHEQWWARLYVAKLMEEEPAFREPELFNKLKRDEHPFVRETLEKIELE
jgi:hypothetical protein